MKLITSGTEIGYGTLSIARIPETLEAAPGSDILLYGDNGAGKTTLLRTLAHLERPTKGNIPTYSVQREIITEDLGLPEDMPALQGIKLLCHKDLFANAMAAAEELGLEYNKDWRELSKGNRQRIRLLIASFSNPFHGVKLYDEPLSGLDIQTINYFLQLWSKTRKDPKFQAIRIFSMHGSHIGSMKWDQLWHVNPKVPGGISYVEKEEIPDSPFNPAHQTDRVDLHSPTGIKADL